MIYSLCVSRIKASTGLSIRPPGSEEAGDRHQATLCLSVVSLLNLKRVQVRVTFLIPTVLTPQKKFQESDFSASCAPAYTCL